jgi:uncharacterized protein YcfL
MGQSYKKWARPALIAGWVLLAAGCAAPAPGTKTEPLQVQQPPQSDKRFVIAPELLNILRVVRVRLSDRQGYLNIQVLVQNITGAPQHFSYHIDWFDKDGVRLPLGSENFIPWMLMPREVSPIAVTAPSPTAADFGIAFIPSVQ